MALTAFLFLALFGAVVALAFALNAMINVFRDKAPYVSTSGWAIRWLAEQAPIDGPMTVYDLGCGDARVLIAIKRARPGIRAIGYERGWWPWLLAKYRSRGTGVVIRYGDFTRADLRDADVVFCFLIASVMAKVEAMLRRQLRPGATVYSYGFAFPTWPIAERITNPDRPQGSTLNVYRA